jgi:hypothetical protein
MSGNGIPIPKREFPKSENPNPKGIAPSSPSPEIQTPKCNPGMQPRNAKHGMVIASADPNPKGIVSSSPRLASLRAYLGSWCNQFLNRNAVAALSFRYRVAVVS